jgi:hypothetical protein
MLLPPVDATGGKHSVAFNFSKYSHASLIVGFGVTAAAVTDFILEACTAQDGTGATAIAFTVAKCETAGGDVLGAQTAVTTSGVVPPATDNIFYVIDIDSASMPAGSDYLRVSIANGSNSALAAIFAILSGARYAGDQSPTVLA